MKHLGLVGALFASAVLFSCDKDDDDDNELNKTDTTFITGAAISNTAEVEAGELAAAKATNPGIRLYGLQMVGEHSVAQAELKVLGTRVGVQVADTVDAQHRALMQLLNSLDGRAFDSAYIHNQVLDHQRTLNLFDTELDDGNHDSVEAYARKYRPHIEMHLVKADSLADAL